LVLGLIIVGIAVAVAAVAVYKGLQGARKDADESFSEEPVGGTEQSCSAQDAECPFPEEKRRRVLDKLKGTGKADDIVEAVDDGDIEFLTLNQAVRDKYNSPDSLALKVGSKVFIDPSASDEVAAADLAHEGTHVLDKTPNQTKDDTLRREMKAFNKQAEVWEALKTDNPELSDGQQDTVVTLKKSGGLEQAVRKAYGIPDPPPPDEGGG